MRLRPPLGTYFLTYPYNLYAKIKVVADHFNLLNMHGEVRHHR